MSVVKMATTFDLDHIIFEFFYTDTTDLLFVRLGDLYLHIFPELLLDLFRKHFDDFGDQIAQSIQKGY